MGRTWLLVAALAAGAVMAPVQGDDDYGHDERPPYQGGLIDSYERYDPQLHKRVYGTPNSHD